MIRKYWDIGLKRCRVSMGDEIFRVLLAVLTSLLIDIGGYVSTSSAQVPETRPLHIYSNPRTVQVEFWWRADVEKKTAEDKDKKRSFRLGKPQVPMFYVWISRPRTWDEQWVTEPQWRNSPPAMTFVDEENGNLIDVWEKEKITWGDSLAIHKRFAVTSFEITYKINAEKVGRYNRRGNLFRQYTKSEDGLQTSGVLRRLARFIVNEEKNPYLRASLLFSWVVENLTYTIEAHEYDAAKVLETKKGDSAHYSLLFVALCRSLDIPSRLVSGHWTTGNRGTHIWVEFYLPNYGWIPADPAEADRGDPEMVTEKLFQRHFGHLDNESIVICKGTNIKLWPQMRGRWLKNFGLDPDGKSQVMQIADYALQGLDAIVKYQYSWSFWE